MRAPVLRSGITTVAVVEVLGVVVSSTRYVERQ